MAPFSPDGLFRNFGDIAVGPNGQVLVSYAKVGPNEAIGPSEIVMQSIPTVSALEPFGTSHCALHHRPGSAPTAPIPPPPPQEARPIDSEGNLTWDISDGEHRGRLYLVYTNSRAIRSTASSPDTNIFLQPFGRATA